MRRRQTLDDLFAFLGEGEEDFAAIIRRDLTDDGGAGDELIDNADGTVVPDLQLLREVADGEFAIGGRGANGEQGLILVRGQVFGDEEVFAETQESPYLITERGEGLKV